MCLHLYRRRVLHYSPKAVLTDFAEKGRKYINRVYLHSLFHCLYLHPADREERDEELWNLACDIVQNIRWIAWHALPYRGSRKRKTEV